MVPNSGYELVNIVAGTDYSPAARTTDYVDPNTGVAESPSISVDNGVTPPIFALLCTANSGGGTVVMQALGNDDNVSIPGNAFVVGQVYYIYLKKLLNAGGVSFVGYRYAQMPLVF